MNKTILMIMGGALLIAVLLAVVVQSKLGGGSKQAQSKTTEILVAKRKLMTGDVLTAEDVKWQTWPDPSLFKGVIKKSDQADEKKLEIYDAPLRRNIENAEPVTRQAMVIDIKGGNNF